MARDDPKFIVRLPADLKAQIEETARASGRSMNAEIVQRLEQSFRPMTSRAEANSAWFIATYAGGMFAGHLAFLIEDYLPYAPEQKKAGLLSLKESAEHFMARANQAVEALNEHGAEGLHLVPAPEPTEDSIAAADRTRREMVEGIDRARKMAGEMATKREEAEPGPSQEDGPARKKPKRRTR